MAHPQANMQFPPMGRGGPGPQQFQGPPQGFPSQLPIRHQSIRTVDLTPPPIPVMDEVAAFKKLTSYAVFTLRKAIPQSGKEKATWARSEVQEEKLAQEDIVKQIKKLKDKGKSVAEKKLALGPNQGSQITNLLDDLIAREQDRSFEWTLAQLDRKEKILKHGMKETLSMTVFLKRSPLKDVNPLMLYQNMERMKYERMMQANRPPQMPQPHPQQHQQPHPQQHQQPHPQQGQQPHPQQGQQPHSQGQKIPIPPQHGGGGGGGGPKVVGGGGVQQIFEMKKKASQSKLPTDKKGDTKNDKKYHPNNKKDYTSDSSSDPYDTDYSYSSDDDRGSFGTSISSRSRDDRRYKDKKRTGSYERTRQHQKDYHIDQRDYPSRPTIQHQYSVPEVPRPPIPGYDAVAAAYRAGKLDADAERHDFNLDRLEQERELFELDRERMMMEQERFTQPRQLMIQRPVVVHEQPPMIVERPVPLNRVLPDRRDQPRAMVSYGRAEGRRPSPPRVYSDNGVRYDDGYEPDYFGQPEREAQDYIESTRPREYVDRRPRQFVDTTPREYVNARPRGFVQERRQSDYVGQRPVEVRYQTTPRPFAHVSLPRRYENGPYC